MKKIISILLAIVMCFTMTTVAFAADETEETPEVSKDNIIAVLLEAAKIASDLNDEAREKMSEELQKLLVDKIAGDSALLQGAAEWIIDKILGLSGADNLLDLDKAQAEQIADLLLKMYDGNLADAIDNPFLKIIVNIIPKDMMKEVVVWLLSDGFGDALQDFINKYEGEGDGTTEDEPKPEEPSDKEENDVTTNIDIATALAAAIQAIKDVVNELITMLSNLFSSLETAPAPAA
ncbi:MAG: hypothetical protein E7536_02855 [Ruminococcaceae bacterium]|nr:hypothetical protein [Oscillospiraceae bacterium]